jgi:pimeloyl-ACP methyl ester carboxylesterase
MFLSHLGGELSMELRSQSCLLLLSAFLLLSPLCAEAILASPSAAAKTGTVVQSFRSADIGHRNLRYFCGGSRSPTVLAEGGPGFSFEETMTRPVPMGWQIVFHQVTARTRMCVYDRANVGKSNAAPTPRTTLDAVHDLHALLHVAHIPPPYVLVGQSAGGFNVRLYASVYRDEVAGMVLIDSSHPDQWSRFRKVLPPPKRDEFWELPGLRAPPGLSLSSERLDLARSAAQVRSSGSLGTFPLIVLTRDPHWAGDPGTPADLQAVMEPVWQDLQRDLLRLTSHSRQIIAVNAGHAIQHDRPHLVSDAIIEVVAQSRHSVVHSR